MPRSSESDVQGEMGRLRGTGSERSGEKSDENRRERYMRNARGRRERVERIHENAEARVEQLRNEIEKIYKIGHDLDEEISKFHEIEKTKAKQVSHLISQIKALGNHQLAHANDIKFVHEENNHLRDGMDLLEEKNSANNNLANYSAIAPTSKKKSASVQFQE